jgi:glycine betaine/proline transport system substrate-binding protein
MRHKILAALAAATLACASAPAASADLVIAMPNWPSGQATANILKVAIAENFGLDAEVREMGTLNAFAGLDAGEVDVHPEVWLPNLDNLVAKYGGENGTVALSPKSVTAWQGLCETRAAADTLGIRNVADLEDPAKIAALDTNADGKGELWIGAPTWSSTAIERIRANSYGYAKQFELIEIEEDVGMAAVDAAVATDQPMVFACYAPHHVFELHDIVRLSEPAYDAAKWKIVLPTEDPKWVENSNAPVAWPEAHFQIAYAKALRSNHADVAALLDRVDFSPEEVTAMSYALQVERRDAYEYAQAWVKEHGERVKGWAAK